MLDKGGEPGLFKPEPGGEHDALHGKTLNRAPHSTPQGFMFQCLSHYPG